MTDDRLREIYQRRLAAAARVRTGCPDPTAILAVVTKSGPEDVRLATTNHVMGCPDCLGEFELLRQLHPPEARAFQLRPWGALAATALIAAGATWWLRGGSRGEVNPVRGAAVAVVSPAAGAVVVEPVRLVWRAVAGARYRVVITGSDGAQRLATATADTTLTLPAGLPPGPLVWEVRAQTADGSVLRSPATAITVRAP